MSPLGSLLSLEELKALGRVLGVVLCCSGLGEGHVVSMGLLLLPFCCSLSYLWGGGEWVLQPHSVPRILSVVSCP